MDHPANPPERQQARRRRRAGNGEHESAGTLVEMDRVALAIPAPAPDPPVGKLNRTNGKSDSWWSGTNDLLSEAKSQISVAQKYGLNLRWVSNSQDFVDAMKNLLTENDVPGRNMIQWQATS